MTRQHARNHFHRVDIADAVRARLTGGWLVNANTEAVYDSPRYKRLCRATALYRVAGFL